jgi:hypothetical protein
MLYLDALHEAPGYGVTLTTAVPQFPGDVYRDACAVLWRRLRRRFGRVEYFSLVEFTTGRAARSGGHRRLHSHNLVKAELGDVLEVEQIVRETWEPLTGACVVEVAELRAPGAAIGYVGLHHRKPSQAPPASWRGMMERYSRGYFGMPATVLREWARTEVRLEAIAHRQGLSRFEAAAELERERQKWEAFTPRLVRVARRPGLSVVAPQGEVVR